MNSTLLWMLILGSAALTFLPSASAGGFYCKTCPTNPLQSPSQCNTSSSEDNCELRSSFTCINGYQYTIYTGWRANNSNCCKPPTAATAELMNGTLVSLKGCYTWQGDCSNITACEQGRNATGAQFKRCIADCCTQNDCNDIVPAMMAAPEPSSSSVAAVVTSTIGSNATTKSPEGPTSAAMKKETLFYLFIFFLIVVYVMS